MDKVKTKKASRVVATSVGDGQEVDSKHALSVDEVLGEDHDLTMAKVRMHPVIHAATTMPIFDTSLNLHSIKSISQELGRHERAVKAGDMSRAESLLINQANTLDVIFNTLAQRAGVNVGKHMVAAERYLRMALKAQSQCRTTLEALAEIKSPKSATFIRQANIAEQQQINHGDVTNGGPAASHEKNNANSSNELLTEVPRATLDTRGTGATGRVDPQLEALVPVDRSENKRRENAQ